MRMFTEEKRSGTIETLFTRPLSDLQIITAKFGASLILIIISLFPTLIYLAAVMMIAYPPGNVDLAGIAGSYIGLLFLCGGFASIGIFASSLTGNQIISFLISVLFCFFFYSGFDLIAGMSNGLTANAISALGISNHYASMSRGVIDSRDVMYFLSLSLMFILLTRFNLEKRKW